MSNECVCVNLFVYAQQRESERVSERAREESESVAAVSLEKGKERRVKREG